VAVDRTVPARWRTTLIGLTAVTAVHFVDALLFALDTATAYFAPQPIHLVVSVALWWVAFGLRREVLTPTRLLETLDDHSAIRNSYLDSVAAIVVTVTPKGVIRHVNRYGLELLGVNEQEIVGEEAFSVITPPAFRDDVAADFRQFVATAGSVSSTAEYPVLTRLGERTVRWRRSALLTEYGEIAGVISYGEDVTEHLRMEESLKSESHLLDSVQDSVVVTALDGAFLYVNQAAYELRGYGREEFLALPPLEWIAPESRDHALQQQQKTIDQGGALYEVVNECRDGRRLPMEVRSHLVEFEGQPAIVNVSRDISARRQAEDLVTQMAFRDPLTGLANRRLVRNRLSQSLLLHGGKPFDIVIMYIDVDNLKAVNDTVGHEGGDKLILAIGERLDSVVREGDTLGRVGGDEFVAVMMGIQSKRQVSEVAQRMLDCLAEPLLIEGYSIPASVSIGIAACPVGLTPDEAFKRADRAMYVAKREGGARFAHYSESMEAAISERFTRRNELENALKRNEFVLHYQPIISTESRRIVGAEALIRWNHPAKGLLPAESFLPLADESGLMTPIGRWVLRTAIEQLGEWTRKGVDVPRIAVNLSPPELLEADLAAEVAELLECHGLPARRLELEITETAAMQRIEETMPVLERLRNMGVRIALDDFGTGHSSLGRLGQLPITTLKIDKSFVSALCSGAISHPIVDTVLVLASNLNLTAVAEGVESRCHFEYLRRRGCSEIQGFLIARPSGAEAFEELVASGPPAFNSALDGHCDRPDCELREEVGSGLSF
jgi:diguanylate cyclase (GGDEF)-like protein/PAS domain S-box-containing protein